VAPRTALGGQRLACHVSSGAALAGTVQAQFAPGTSVANSYTILSAAGGRGGTTFDDVTAAIPNLGTSPSYTATEVILNLTAAMGVGTNLNPNQQNVAGSINGFFNNGAALPPGFVTVFGLTGRPLATALTQLSGEHATGIQRATRLSTGLFLNAMLDPFVMGRAGGYGAGSAMAYAPEAAARSLRRRYAAEGGAAGSHLRAALERVGAGYGGRSHVDGDPIIMG
jgi:hypothetical protein